MSKTSFKSSFFPNVVIPYFGNKTYQLLNNFTVQNDIKKFEIDKKFNFVSPATSA